MAKAGPHFTCTQREEMRLQVADLLIQKVGTHEIARRLNMAQSTASYYKEGPDRCELTLSVFKGSAGAQAD